MQNGFRRVRADHETEIAEDYVEAIHRLESEQGRCRGADLARFFAVSHATVTQTIARLKEAGLVDPQPYGPITLTSRGLKIAREARSRHETVVQFLRAIGVSEETARSDAEGIEHHVSDETLERLQQCIRGQARGRRSEAGDRR
jgi:DtxR family manganese transport transcriptional regulator